jgi:hypothetical protein
VFEAPVAVVVVAVAVVVVVVVVVVDVAVDVAVVVFAKVGEGAAGVRLDQQHVNEVTPIMHQTVLFHGYQRSYCAQASSYPHLDYFSFLAHCWHLAYG